MTSQNEPYAALYTVQQNISIHSFLPRYPIVL
ncbi:hypothetical protein F975_00494 [Acinetobacter sp. ANC 3789]|nr:hypothetical protein F975_00494 [Acinetobacter sp. ANC 3789]